MVLEVAEVKTYLRKFDRKRKNTMSNWAQGFLYLIANNKHTEKQILSADEVKEIVIVRSNSRVGNTVFLLPFIRQVQAAYPRANITLLLNKPGQKEVFANMGIHQFEFTHLSLKNIWKSLSSIVQLRKKSYDLCLSPSISGQASVLCALLDARNKISYTSKYNQAFTHTFNKQRIYTHTALSCLCLIPQIQKSTCLSQEEVNHYLTFSGEELSKGYQSKNQISAGNELCLAFFRGARGDKRLSDDTWRTILDKFNRCSDNPIVWVEVMGPEISEPLNPELPAYRSSSLRELAAFLRHTDAFISCDTGPLHLADAAGATCIGLYSHTDPAVYGLLGKSCIHVDDIDGLQAENILSQLKVDQIPEQQKMVSNY